MAAWFWPVAKFPAAKDVVKRCKWRWSGRHALSQELVDPVCLGARPTGS